MKIAVAYGVWPFWGWKIINHGGWFTQVKGRSWQKKRSSLYRSCLHERVILPDYRITSLLQFIHHFYNTFTTLLQSVHHFYNTFASLLHHSFSSYVTFILCAICTSDPLPECAENGFSGCAGNASRPRNKLRPRSPFSGGTFHRVSTTRQRIGSLIGCHAPECITIHARKTHRSYSERFSGGKVCCFEAQAENRAQAVSAVRVMWRYGK